MVRMVPSCAHLELIPQREDVKSIMNYIEEVRRVGGSVLERFYEFLMYDGLRLYDPHCKKHDGVCVIMESPVISQKHYGDNVESIRSILNDAPKVKKCPDREVPENNEGGCERLPHFLHKRIVEPLINRQRGLEV